MIPITVETEVRATMQCPTCMKRLTRTRVVRLEALRSANIDLLESEVSQARASVQDAAVVRGWDTECGSCRDRDKPGDHTY